MSTGWGTEAIQIVNDAGELVPEGTTAEDVRQIWGALYSPGVISGCSVHTSAQGMTYTVDPGVIVIPTVQGSTPLQLGQSIIAPVPGTEVTVSPNGGSSRLDKVYAEQVMDVDNNNIRVGVAEGTDIPPNSQLIAEFTAMPNSTATNTSYFTGTVPFSVPYGANMGIFLSHTDTSSSALPYSSRIAYSSTMRLQTDRKIIISIDACLSALRPNGTRAVGFDNSAYCETYFDVYIDDVPRFKFTSPGLSQAWATYHFQEYWNLKAGLHTISYRTSAKGPGVPTRHHFGSNRATGITFSVRDGGFWEG